MNTRSRNGRSLPAVNQNVHHITKREQEGKMTSKTCPPGPRKSIQYLKHHRLLAADTAKILKYSRPASLSTLYDPTKDTTYFQQVYNIHGVLGEGSFGTVYKVVSREDQQAYAIKTSKYDFLQYVEDEVKRLEKVGEHINIVKFYYAWEEKNYICIKLELCSTCLELYTRFNHDISEAEQWDILIDMALALKFLHNKNYMHLDLKPANIMIGKNGIYKLADFGLLLNLEKDIKDQLRCPEGDARYLAPEVFEGAYTPAADIFSLGLTMLELATDLVLPLRGPLWTQLRIGYFDNEYFKRVPRKLRCLIRKMMHPKPSCRPSAAKILAHNHVKKVLAHRQLNRRINYYNIWRNEHAEVTDNTPVIRVCVNPAEGSPVPLEFERNMQPVLSLNSAERVITDNSENVQEEDIPDARNNNANRNPDAGCVTPPRRMSQVILYNL